MPLRVAVLTNIPSPYQVELFDAIAARGEVDVRVWYCAEQDVRRLWGPRSPVHPHRVGNGWRFSTARDHYYLDPRLAGEIVKWRPDLAVLSVYTMPSVQLAMWQATLRRIPWVYWGEAVATGGVGWARSLLRAAALFPVRRWAAGLFAVGGRAVGNFRRLIGRDRPILNVPYFSNLRRFMAYHGPGFTNEGATFLYVGSFSYRKGADIVAQAFSELIDDIPSARLVVAGDGDTRDLFDRHLSASAAARVIRRGFVPWEALPTLYSSGHFLVMPSRYDGWGLVVPEAMASGVPVIGSTGSGAVLDLVRDGETGWQFPPSDAKALARKMKVAATVDPERWTRMREQCRLRSQRYDVAVGARVFARATRAVLNANDARGEN